MIKKNYYCYGAKSARQKAKEGQPPLFWNFDLFRFPAEALGSPFKGPKFPTLILGKLIIPVFLYWKAFEVAFTGEPPH